MKERLERRVLGAIRWVDAVTGAPIPLPLVARSDTMRFTRNLSGLAVITHADGLERYPSAFDIDDLDPADVVTPGALQLEGEVRDPSGTYLPRRFTLNLPRDPSPDIIPPAHARPANSLFTPVDVALLPSPVIRLPPGCAQVRVLICDSEGDPAPNSLARVVATANETLLGCGLADARGEALVAIPGLKHFAPGDSEDEVVSVETEARLEIIHPPTGQAIVDWQELRDADVADEDADVDPTPLKLKPGWIYSRRYPFTT
jgi:hypothetical protein